MSQLMRLSSISIIGFSIGLSIILSGLLSCNSAHIVSNEVWGLMPEQAKERLEQRELTEITQYLNERNGPKVMQQALLLGQDSLYTIALIFSEQGEWDLYRRSMLAEVEMGSPSGKKIALNHIAAHNIFSDREHLDALDLYLREEHSDAEQSVKAAELALELGKVAQAQGYWDQVQNRGSEENLKQALLGLRLALLQRNSAKANHYMRAVVLDYATLAEHQKLQEDLDQRSEWRELILQTRNGAELLQSLAWKVALLKKQFSKTLPVLLQKTESNKNLGFWWQQHTLIGDTGRALFAANRYRSQSANVALGRQYLKNLLEQKSASRNKAYQYLAYWYVRNARNYANLNKYKPFIQQEKSLSSWLLIEYLYLFQKAKYWKELPGFLDSWHGIQLEDQGLSRTSIRQFKDIYRSMLAQKNSEMLRQVFEAALQWGNEELILDSAWNYRLAKRSALDDSEWQRIPESLRSRVQADIRLFAMRADRVQNLKTSNHLLLPKLRAKEPVQRQNKEQQDLHALLSSLVAHGLNAEALRLARLYHGELAPQNVVEYSRNIQQQGDYGTSMRMVGQLTYDPNYAMSREALELFYPKAFYELMESYTSEYNLPLAIFYGLVRQESYFAHAVTSHAGAVGLSQLMPATMNEMARKIGYRNPDATDPDTNLKIGSYYLRYLINHRWINNFGQALMAYNAGLGNIRKWKARLQSKRGLEFNNAIPILETRLYVQKISAGAIYYSILYGWNNPYSVLNTIYPEDFSPKK